jgi:hypothetical protein
MNKPSLFSKFISYFLMQVDEVLEVIFIATLISMLVSILTLKTVLDIKHKMQYEDEQSVIKVLDRLEAEGYYQLPTTSK